MKLLVVITFRPVVHETIDPKSGYVQMALEVRPIQVKVTRDGFVLFQADNPNGVNLDKEFKRIQYSIMYSGCDVEVEFFTKMEGDEDVACDQRIIHDETCMEVHGGGLHLCLPKPQHDE